MKIKESELRDIIKDVLEEAIGRQDARLANKFIRQNSKGGYTSTRAADNEAGSRGCGEAN